MTDHDETTRCKGNAMTSPIYTALYEAISDAMDNVADMDTTRQDFAKAATEAAMKACGPRELVWMHPSDGTIHDENCRYEIERDGRLWRLIKGVTGGGSYIGHFGTLEAAKSAAQSHADAAHWANTVIGAEVGNG